LYAIGKISGRVLDAAGRGVPKAGIDLSDETPAGGGWMFQAGEKGEFNSEEVRSRGRLEGTENEQGRAWSTTISPV
jgi:protocatechuate 3,4-dioxygenase beta subunit